VAIGDKPKHRVIFGVFILVLGYALFSVSLAVMNHNDCDDVSDGKKTWTVVPPEWECGGKGRIQFTSDD